MTNTSRADVIRCHYFNSVTATRAAHYQTVVYANCGSHLSGAITTSQPGVPGLHPVQAHRVIIIMLLYQRLFKYEAWVESCLQCILLTEAVAK